MIHENEATEFLIESNHIEGIVGATADEVSAAMKFLSLSALTVQDVSDYVAVTAEVSLRSHRGDDVRVGGYHPPGGGSGIEPALEKILRQINRNQLSPFEAHVEFELLHPYMDGNGRAGRLIWLWHMRNNGLRPRLSFLHHFYYQTLAAAEKE